MRRSVASYRSDAVLQVAEKLNALAKRHVDKDELYLAIVLADALASLELKNFTSAAMAVVTYEQSFESDDPAVVSEEEA